MKQALPKHIIASGNVRVAIWLNRGQPEARLTLERLAVNEPPNWFPAATYSPQQVAALMQVLQAALDYLAEPPRQRKGASQAQPATPSAPPGPPPIGTEPPAGDNPSQTDEPPFEPDPQPAQRSEPQSPPDRPTADAVQPVPSAESRATPTAPPAPKKTKPKTKRVKLSAQAAGGRSRGR